MFRGQKRSVSRSTAVLEFYEASKNLRCPAETEKAVIVD